MGISLGVNVRVVRVFAHLRADIDVVYTYRVAIAFIAGIAAIVFVLFTSLKNVLPLAFFEDECATLFLPVMSTPH